MSEEDGLPREIERTIDREAGVVIYTYSDYNEGGLAVVPISETELMDNE